VLYHRLSNDAGYNFTDNLAIASVRPTCSAICSNKATTSGWSARFNIQSDSKTRENKRSAKLGRAGWSWGSGFPPASANGFVVAIFALARRSCRFMVKLE